MSDVFEVVDNFDTDAVIKVIGVGGGGGNAVKHMIQNSIEGVEFLIANTDAQALRNNNTYGTIQLGAEITKGLGAGANPEIGRQAAEEAREEIRAKLEGADMVFIAAGMGGGTGTGAAPVVAEVAKELGILTVAVVTKPFPFEGNRRMAAANEGIAQLARHVDSLITIPNEKLLKVLGKSTSLLAAFAEANNVLLGAVQGISDLITRDGLINVDFADVRTVMREMGTAMMGSGIASGEDRASEAAEMAINSPLLEDIDLSGARGVLLNITAGMDLSMEEFETVGNIVKGFVSENATVIVGTVIDMDMSDELRVTVVATGIGGERKPDISIVTKPKTEERPTYGSRTTPNRTAGYGGATAPKFDQELDEEEQELVEPQATKPAAKPQGSQRNDMDYLDIPAFLRRQVD